MIIIIIARFVKGFVGQKATPSEALAGRDHGVTRLQGVLGRAPTP